MTSRTAAQAAALSAALGCAVAPEPAAAVHGGCINTCWRWETARGPVFVKIADRKRLPMLEAERDGLLELRTAQAVRVPEPLAVGNGEGGAYLVLEWIDGNVGTRSASVTASSES